MARMHLLIALTAFTSFVCGQQATTTAPDASTTVTSTSNTLPDCVPLCMQAKFGEQETLAPSCNVNDLFCLCTTSRFVTAYRQCLFDNCANTQESMLGRQTWASICADSGAALLTYTAVHDPVAATSAIQEVAGVLQMPVSGVAPTQASNAFDPNQAVSFVSQNYDQQVAYATSAALVSLSGAAAQATASLQNQAAAISASLRRAEQQASAMEQGLAATLSGSALAAAQAQMTASLSMMEAQASAAYESAVMQAQASLQAQSNAVFQPSTSALPTGNVNAHSSSATAVKASISLLSLALAAVVFL